MEKIEKEKRLKLGLLKSNFFSSYINIPSTWNLELTDAIFKEILLCGGIN
jgi:hypothetical protein